MFAHIAMVFQLYDANVSSDLDICCKDFDLHVAVLDGVTGDCCCRSGVQPCVGRKVGTGCSSLLRTRCCSGCSRGFLRAGR